MITETTKVRVRYNEVDQMGYVYHGNYVNYCHAARTHLLRTLNIEDKFLEEQGFLLPVIEMNLRYKKPAVYDEVLSIKTSLKKVPTTRWTFYFEIYNEQEELICMANTVVVLVDQNSRKPIRIPEFIKTIFEHKLKSEPYETNRVG